MGADSIMKASSELDAIVPEIWSKSFFPVLLASLPFNDLVSRDYEGEIKALGDTVRAPQVPEFGDATDIAEDEKNDADAVTVTTTSLIVNKQTVKDFIITDRALAQSIDAADQFMARAFYSIMKRMQVNYIAEIVPNAATPDHSIAYTSGTTLALADFLAAKELLDTQDVPDDGTRSAVLGVAQQNDLFNITGFTSRDYVPNANAMSSGAIVDPILGFRVRWTTEVGTTSRFFHPSFLQSAVQRQPEVKKFDLGGQGVRAQRVNMTTLYGIKQFDGLRVVSLS